MVVYAYNDDIKRGTCRKCNAHAASWTIATKEGMAPMKSTELCEQCMSKVSLPQVVKELNRDRARV